MAVPGPTTQRNVERLAGNLLRLAREERGWSQAQLAAAARVPASTVGRIEAGQRQPSLVTLYRLLAAADVDLRVRLEPYDDHDDVLDARDAARSPRQRAVAEERHDANVGAFRDAAQRPVGQAGVEATADVPLPLPLPAGPQGAVGVR